MNFLTVSRLTGWGAIHIIRAPSGAGGRPENGLDAAPPKSTNEPHRSPIGALPLATIFLAARAESLARRGRLHRGFATVRGPIADADDQSVDQQPASPGGRP